MIRLSRLADYAIVIMTPMSGADAPLYSAQNLADRTSLSVPTVSKILKILLRAKLLTSSRGSRGGYRIARPADEITMTDIIEAVDGPIALTDCVTDDDEPCAIQSCCPTQQAWSQINRTIRESLNDLSLADITRPLMFLPEEKRLEVKVGSHAE